MHNYIINTKAAATTLLITLFSLLPAVRAQSTRPADGTYQMTAAANEEKLWLIQGRYTTNPAQPEKKYWLQRFALMGKQATEPEPVMAIEPQVGRIDQTAAAGQRLHVFYVNERDQSTHYTYSRDRWWREVQLPGRRIPLALAGAQRDNRPILWALVDAQTADTIEQQWRQRQADEEVARRRPKNPYLPAESAPAPALPAAGPPRTTGSLHLVRYEEMQWRPGPPAPVECRDAERYWLVETRGRLHIFWQENGDDPAIRNARQMDEHWVELPAIQLSAPPLHGYALVTNAQLFFVAALAYAGDDDLVRYETWIAPAAGTQSNELLNGWSRGPNLTDPEGQELIVSARAALTAFKNQFVIFSRRDKQSQVGFWAADSGSNQRPWSAIEFQSSQQQRHFYELLTLISLMIMLSLIYWRRQRSFALPINLPPELVLAGYGKRFVAACLDLLPASMLVSWLWQEPLEKYYGQLPEMMFSGNEPQAMNMTVFLAGIVMVLLYAFYCAIFELWMQATPGKKLLGLRVVTEEAQKPHILQILIRNASRIFEINPVMGIWLMLIVFFTRNRQRLGDLIGRTVVVENRKFVRTEEPPPQDPDSTEPPQ